MQTLCTDCSKVEPNFFAPPQTPFLGARDSQNLISWRRSLPSPTDPVWWRSMHTISSYCGNRPTNRQEQLQYTMLQLSAQCKNVRNHFNSPYCFQLLFNRPVYSGITPNPNDVIQEPLGMAVTGQMPFMLLKQQCQSTDNNSNNNTTIISMVP